MLYSLAALGVLATLLSVRPDPQVRGYVFVGEATSCDQPSELEAETFAYWNRRIAEVHWADPRAGWQADMRATLYAAPGVVVSVRVERRNAIMPNRELLARLESAKGWMPLDEQIPLCDANGSCASYLVGTPIRGYHCSEEIRPPDAWPPRDLLKVLVASRLEAIPDRWPSL